MKRFLLAMALCLPAATAVAEPLTYKLDPGHTQVLVRWEHFGFSHPSANFGQVDGSLVYDADDIAASSVQVILPLSGLDSFVPKLDTHLRSADFFDAEKFPDITYKSTAAEAAGADRLKVAGDLTIKGITRPVVLDVVLNKAAVKAGRQHPTIGFDATATIKRSDFDVGAYAPNVSDEVTLRITTEGNVPKPDADR